MNFHQKKNKWKHKLILIEFSKRESDGVTDLLIYKDHSAFNKNLHVFMGICNKNFICRRCLNSYTNEYTLKNHEEICGKNDIFTTKTSSESHFYWNYHFHKNSVFFKNIAEFEADNTIDNSSTGNETTII